MSHTHLRQSLRYSLVGLTAFLISLTHTPAAFAAWNLQQTNSAQPLNAVDFFDTNKGIAVGETGTVRYTSNGGTTWQSTTTNESVAILDVGVAYGTTTAYAVGTQGKIYKSTDAGATWSSLVSGTNAKLNAVSVSSANIVLAVGSNGLIIRTTDGGATWTTLNANTVKTLYAAASTVSGHIIVGAEGGTLFRSNDSGTTWSQIATGSASDIMGVKIFGGNASVIYAVGKNRLVAASFDSGATWTIYSNIPSGIAANTTFYSATGPDSTKITIVGDNGSVITTTDGGTNWSNDSITTSAALTDIGIPPASYDNKFIVSTNGDVYSYSAAAPTAPSAPTNLSIAFASSATNNATTDNTPFISWNAATAGTNTITDYQIKIDGNSYTSLNNTLNYTANILSDGQHTVRVRAVDSQGLASSDVLTTFYVDTIAPSVSSPTPTSAATGVLTTVSVIASDATSGIKTCRLLINNVDQGSMSQIANSQEFIRTYNFATADTYGVRAKCTDYAGHESLSGMTVVTASTSGATLPSNTTPSASMSYLTASPAQGVANNTSNVLVSVTVRNSNGQVLANKLVTLNTNRPNNDTIATIANTTNDLGQATFYVRSNAIGSSLFTAVVNGSSVGTIGVVFSSAVVNTDPVPSFPSPGSLVKLSCPPGADSNHMCRAVYFVTADGKRHAFPNAKIYASWYPDFSGVQTVSAEVMASMPLGKNITYRPGVRMIKFVTSPKVYVIGKNGKLHAIASEAVAKGLYGTAWNKKIDDLSDAFLGDYWFSNDIVSNSQFAPLSETENVPTPLYNY